MFGLTVITNIFIKSQESLDVLKNLYRSIFDTRKLKPTLLSIKEGFRNQQRKVLEMSNAILTQTDKESEFLERDFDVKVRCTKIQLGVSDEFLNPKTKNYFDFNDYILTVGRIEPRKNQLKIIEAVKILNRENGLNLKLVVVGSLNSNNFEYYHRFNRLVKENPFVVYVPKVKYEDMPSVYQSAKVCVSGSYFETTGLTLIEAALSGTNVVARNGDTGEVVKEYLGTMPEYCEPWDVESIKDAIWRAYSKPKSSVSPEFREKYTWANVAKETLKVYNGLVK
jgi:glycosyltransferase involved in cell wall biosynthesis